MKDLALVVAMGVCTLGLRASFLLWRGRPSPSLEAMRRVVPVVALTALVVPSLVPADGEVPYARLVAALAAGAVAFKTRSMFLTVGTAMGMLWWVLYG